LKSGDGKDYAYIAQRFLFLVDGIFDNELSSVILLSSFLAKLTHVPSIKCPKNLANLVSDIVNIYIQKIAVSMPNFLGRSKVHHLLHFPEYICRFGLFRLITSDLGEKKNGPQRHYLFNSNRQSPSRDVGNSFCLRDTILHVCRGGLLPEKEVGIRISELAADTKLMAIIGNRSAPIPKQKKNRFVGFRGEEIGKVVAIDESDKKCQILIYKTTGRWNNLACQILSVSNEKKWIGDDEILTFLDVLEDAHGNMVRNSFYYDDSRIDLEEVSLQVRRRLNQEVAARNELAE
jgi:hypothetical protein